MSSLHLVTGYAGKEHVTSADQGSFHANLLLNGSYVLNVGNKFAATIVSNNSIKIQDGDILMQGRYIKLDSGTFIEVPIENGAQDYKRNDLIVVRYTKNASSGVESTALVVIKGTPDIAEAVDPAYTNADILDGALVCDMPLYRVPIDGLNVGALVPLFDVVDSFDARLEKKADKAHKHTKAEITDFPTSIEPTAHKHKKSDISDFPETMPPSAHNQEASTITAGTLGGQVVANAAAVATLGTKQVRNIYAGTAELTAGTSALPTGDIYIQYE